MFHYANFKKSRVIAGLSNIYNANTCALFKKEVDVQSFGPLLLRAHVIDEELAFFFFSLNDREDFANIEWTTYIDIEFMRERSHKPII